MKAIVLEGIGGIDNFRLIQMPIPEPKSGEVRIRIKAAGFNPVDIKIRNGGYGDSGPIVLGADCSGLIDAIGAGVTEFTIGDEVYAMPFGQSSNGSYAQYVCLPYQFVAKKPKHLSFEEAASIPLAALTAYRATTILDFLNKNEAIFIAGAAGGVGCFAVQFANYFQYSNLYTVAGSNDTSTFLREKLGFRTENILLYIENTPEELRDKFITLNNGNLFIATFDFVGKDCKKLCIDLTAYSGHVVSIVPEEPYFDGSAWSKEGIYFERNLSLHSVFIGAESYSKNPKLWEKYKEEFSQITHLLNMRKIRVPFHHSLGELEVDTVKRAHYLIENKNVRGKLVMSVD